MESKSDTRVRYGLVVLRAMREDAGLSQQAMANEMDLSLVTVSSWEHGKSCPDVAQAWQWYDVTGLNPVPYLMRWQYPDHTRKGFDIAALHRAIEHLPPEEQEILLYTLTGEHGCCASEILSLLCIYVHLPLKARLTHSSMVRLHYNVAKSQNALVNPECPLPNIDIVDLCIEREKQAVMNGEENYHLLLKEKVETRKPHKAREDAIEDDLSKMR